MFFEAIKHIKTAILLLILMTAITGGFYPAVVTEIAQLLFPFQANGSLIIQDHKYVGSRLIGQEFSNFNYFWGRESATAPFPYTAEASAGSNYGPSHPNFYAAIKSRVEVFRAADPLNVAKIPVDLVTASASGLDPEISPLGALYQVHRVATARHLSEAQIIQLVDAATHQRWGGILGEPRVNVLQLNLALDELESHAKKIKMTE